MIAAFRSILLAASPVTEIVGQRIYPKTKPLNERQPSIVLSLISDVPDYHFEGPSNFDGGRIWVDCWAATYAAATSLASAVQTALENYSGTIEGKSIGWIEISDRADIDETIEDGSNKPNEFGIQLDAEFLRI